MQFIIFFVFAIQKRVDSRRFPNSHENISNRLQINNYISWIVIIGHASWNFVQESSENQAKL